MNENNPQSIMTELTLKDELMRDAREKGICAPGYGLMRVYDREELISYYIANPDWCMERDFPSLELLRREFSGIEDKGVYIGKTFNGETFDSLQAYIFHNCKGTIKVAMDYDNAVIPMLYFANGCDITVSCEQKNTPPVRIPIYETEECNNVVNLVESEGCEFKRHMIKPIEL